MSKDLNKVMISGRLGKDVELRVTPNGSSVSTFSVASSRSLKQSDGSYKEQTEWFRVVAWEKLAETCANFLKKGSHVFIEGRLQTREWQDQEGQKHQVTEVIATEMYMLGAKRQEGEETGANYSRAGALFEEELEPDSIPF
ncbi:MAG TPA: single-stranded DNA-binding protein [Chloroflexia bacterium]|nr:single-stranded DNA-binding protein [Chloroflexia bacterium]